VSIPTPAARLELASILAKGFGTSSRKRGEEYFLLKRVKVRVGSARELSAVVKGSEPYEVLLKFSGSKLAVSCTCPHFLDHGQACKHLWAAILTADETGFLADATSATGITLNPSQITDDQGSGLRSAPVIITPARPAVTPIKAPLPNWKTQMGRIVSVAASYRTEASPWPAQKEVVYLLDVPKSQEAHAVVLTIATGERKKEGGWKSIPRPFSIHRDRIAGLPLLEDRELLSMLLGGGQYSSYGYLESYDRGPTTFSLSSVTAATILPRVLRTGRCLLPFEKHETDKLPLQWDDGEPWKFVLEVHGSRTQGWQLSGSFHRGPQRMGIDEPLLTVPGGFLFTRDRVARLAEEETFPWIAGLRNNNAVVFSEEEREEFLSHLICSPALPLLDLPDELQYEEVTLSPRNCLKITQNRYSYKKDQNQMRAELSFEYGARSVPARDVARGIYEASTRRFFRRDVDAEKAASAQLYEVGLRYVEDRWVQDAGWNLAASKIPRVVRALVESGWHVTAEGKVFRHPGQTSVSVSSGVDWFELHGAIEFGNASAPLPQLLAALKRGETMVTLGDGSYGLLPEEWLRRFGPVAAMGEAEGDHIRFRSNQAGVLDALLATQPAVDCDEAFRRVREELARFQSISSAPQPTGFQGRLRDYQREGLGWMHFLRQFSFGGCLADDMGVGKTAQVLALLETRRELRAEGKIDAPSLVVVPKSLIFNWKQEVERFTPQIRVLDYTGIGRNKNDLSGYDLILTTYGTLRRDAVHFKDQVFDYVILDEAQAVKNARTESAKAVRLLRGNHRLALSGTPVENHLGELWTLLDFLNPGMMGASGVFQLAGGAMRNPSDDARKLLAHALRPFLLRRTKEQVATELPPKVEQTIYCEMEPRQRTLYNELREHYRKSLLPKIHTDGIAKSKIQVLEALLRLRQAACHPGLIDRKRTQDPSAKLDVLTEQLRAVLEEGHKALVFSQFTSLLGIVRKVLQKDGIEHEYLDGKTHDRQARVERFQNDPGCPLFLISLKAGGVGLNLTAADYVFILDPWWNPAVEAQAVDRTHRIGQSRQVFAYRLITRDTVEEKVLELQQTKRGLADAILGAENSLIRDLRREDIELLLS
jgi:hypothetical protein